MQSAGKRYRPRPEFRLRMQRKIAARARFSWGRVGLAATAAVAVLFLVGLVTSYLGRQQLERELAFSEVADLHVAALASANPVDIVSTDRHTVKPWFAGHADVSPVVADFEPQGYRLVGGRADYFARQRAAVVVYAHGPHVINVFSWVSGAGGLPPRATRSGYHLAFWRAGNLEYCAISDAGWDELLGLVSLLRELAARDARD